MTQIYTINYKTLYHPWDHQGTSMPSAVKADQFYMVCLTKAGSSGYLGPGAGVRILE